MSGTFLLRLAKEDFKFSAAHFTVLGNSAGEALHGHNYRVSVELRGSDLDELDFLLPVRAAKRDIRAQCAALDEKTLLPAKCPHLGLNRHDDTMAAVFGSRRYEFPVAEVVLLPVANVTMEALARLIWQRLRDRWRHLQDRIGIVEVTVAETRGQSASYRRRLRSRQEPPS